MVTRDPQTPANDYLIFAILVTIFCCWPLGIVAIIKALEVRSLNDRRDYTAAERASQEAKKWSIGTLICGIVTEVIAVVIIIVYYVVIAVALTGSINNTFDNIDNNFDQDDFFDNNDFYNSFFG